MGADLGIRKEPALPELDPKMVRDSPQLNDLRELQKRLEKVTAVFWGVGVRAVRDYLDGWDISSKHTDLGEGLRAGQAESLAHELKVGLVDFLQLGWRIQGSPDRLTRHLLRNSLILYERHRQELDDLKALPWLGARGALYTACDAVERVLGAVILQDRKAFDEWEKKADIWLYRLDLGLRFLLEHYDGKPEDQHELTTATPGADRGGSS